MEAATTAGESHLAIPTDEERPSTPSSVVALLLCGLPASGKSSLAKQVCEKVQQSSNHDSFFRTGSCHLIEYDALQESLTDNETDILEAWRQTRGIALRDFQKVLSECVESLETQKQTDDSSLSSLVILDDNFHLPSMRKQVYQSCQKVVASHSNGAGNSSVDVYFGIVYFDTPVALCLERNRHRHRQRQRAQSVVVSDEVIVKMHDTLQPPPVPNAFWEQAAAVLRIDGSQENNDNSIEEHTHDNVQRVLDFAATLCQQPESRVPPPVDPALEQERLAAERKRTATSAAHATDQSLRQLVRVVAQVRPAAASHANNIRQACLQRAKKEPAACNHPQDHSVGAGDGSFTVGVHAASDSFIEQVLQWPDWTDDERLDVKTRLSSSAAALHE
jgi:tRNA uridine 5-carbamoylmethylation protein Kti12